MTVFGFFVTFFVFCYFFCFEIQILIMTKALKAAKNAVSSKNDCKNSVVIDFLNAKLDKNGKPEYGSIKSLENKFLLKVDLQYIE